MTNIVLKISFCFVVLVLSFHSIAAYSTPAGFAFRSREASYGSMQVPLDWDDPHRGTQITLVYKLLRPDDVQKPLMVFMGGGPASATLGGYKEALEALSAHYRVLIFDQRGVGLSAPIELGTALGSAAQVPRLFGPLAIAKDLNFFVSRFVGAQEHFTLAGHSFGTLVVYHYLAMESTRLPSQIIQLGPVTVAKTGARTFLNERLRVQIAQNRKLAAERPDLLLKLELARIKFDKLMALDKAMLIKGNELDTLFYMLHPEFWGRLQTTLDEFLVEPDASEAVKGLGAWALFAEPLIYAIDWSWPKRISQPELVAHVPQHIRDRIEPWMLVETRALMSKEVIARLPEETKKLFEQLDRDLANHRTILNLKTLRARVANVPALYLAGDTDPFIPYETAKADFAQIFTNPQLHHFEPVEGGHHWSVHSDVVVDFIPQHFARVQSQRTCQSIWLAH